MDICTDAHYSHQSVSCSRDDTVIHDLSAAWLAVVDRAGSFAKDTLVIDIASQNQYGSLQNEGSTSFGGQLDYSHMANTLDAFFVHAGVTPDPGPPTKCALGTRTPPTA